MRKVPISIIVPTFNRSFRLESLIKRLSLQTVCPGELIIIDNSMLGDAKTVFDRLSGETPFILRYLREKRKGPTYGMNMGINKAKYPVLAFLDDDCLPVFDWLERIYDVLKNSDNKIVKGANSNGFPNSITACAYHLFVESVINSGIYHFKKDIYSRYLDSKNFAARKILFVRIGLFDSRFSQYSAMYDLDMAERIRRKNIKILYRQEIKTTHYGRSGLGEFLYRCFEMGRARATFYDKWHQCMSDQSNHKYSNKLTSKIKTYQSEVNRRFIADLTKKRMGIWIIGFRLVNYFGRLFSFWGYQFESVRLFMRKAMHGPGHLSGVCP